MKRLIAALICLVTLTALSFAMDFGARVKVATPLISFGDSMTVGSAASDAAHRYTNLLAAKIGGTLNNQGVSGTGMADQARKAFTVVPVLNGSVISVMAGFNDLLRTGSASFLKIQSNLRALIANALLKEAIPASQMSCTGTWLSAGGSDGGKAITLGGNGLYTTDGPSSHCDWTFFGETLVVGSWTTSPAIYKDFNVSIDGGAPIVFHSAGMTDDAYPATNFNALVVKNLGFARHTVSISPISAGSYTIIDYVGTLAAPGAVAPVLVAHIPSMTNWTYNGNTLSPATLTDANVLIASVIAEFPGWARLAPTNDFYTPGACCTATDGEHPTDMGHAQIASSLASQIGLASQ